MADERLARRRAERRERQALQAVHQVTQPLHTLPTYELVSTERPAQLVLLSWPFNPC